MKLAGIYNKVSKEKRLNEVNEFVTYLNTAVSKLKQHAVCNVIRDDLCLSSGMLNIPLRGHCMGHLWLLQVRVKCVLSDSPFISGVRAYGSENVVPVCDTVDIIDSNTGYQISYCEELRHYYKKWVIKDNPAIEVFQETLLSLANRHIIDMINIHGGDYELNETKYLV